MTNTLILWDIDLTLVNTVGMGAELYAIAFKAVTGREMGAVADMAGRTEKAILTETLALNGIETGDFAVFYTALEAAARTLEPRMRASGHALPGAAAAIAGLAGDGVLQSVVTGNLRSIAEMKLAAFGLHHAIDFTVGAYGDDDHDRAVLVALARERAQARHGLAIDPARVVVIGDTPHDVKGALDRGAIAVGVATGRSSAERLAAAGAHVVVPDLSGVVAAIRARLDA
ncbi:haloacid dehalogenase [Actinorhabdospora filicis]|uniref:Haloacid dehalogenase n=1 Tax=Actinorhabdospora filicis TaxID=1785913 RepID=A0A9W6SKC2_9ACTN|nr:haloacid dehalogenase-like hydrolase [Actinorhabdospora filicis]GLZ77505.1 haloacid dehalogenase [Actinorhabdospora filicis]